MKIHLICVVTVITISLLPYSNRIKAQELALVGPTQVQCGEIVESDFTTNYEEHGFSIDLDSGDILEVSVSPVGEQLDTGIIVTGPTNIAVSTSAGRIDTERSRVYTGDQLDNNPRATSRPLSARGRYFIRVFNFRFSRYDYAENQYSFLGSSGGIGSYTLFIGCTLRDGTVIEPGDSIIGEEEESQNSRRPENQLAEPFSGVGFPGLPSVDFSGALRVSFNLSAINEGEIPPTSDAVLGYRFEANAGDVFELSFSRTGGNLNLGIVLLSGDNQVIYVAVLTTSRTMTTQLILPTTGEYTVGVFRVDILPPEVPEATSFQLAGQINP